ncbi:MAG: hypothetical protein IPM40_12460 [Gammaproteobacteria bacterium]|nr:hypothetical protein [Gammaproteobacteria bacterium]
MDAFLERAAACQPGAVRKRYLLLSTPRTGSNWLAHELRSEGEMGYPYEWFSPVYLAAVLARLGRPFDRRHYSDLVFAGSTTPNGVFGLKAQLDQVIRLRNEQQFDLLELGFDTVIWLERRERGRAGLFVRAQPQRPMSFRDTPNRKGGSRNWATHTSWSRPRRSSMPRRN